MQVATVSAYYDNQIAISCETKRWRGESSRVFPEWRMSKLKFERMAKRNLNPGQPDRGQ